MPNRVMLAACLAAVLAGGWAVRAADAEGGDPDAGGVRLLKYPYPYEAALTVNSDIDSASVEKFEAVHRLVNTRERIARGSAEWDLLFADPAIDRVEAWRNGIDGFGLPLADSFQLYAPGMGVFAAYDRASGQPVPHAHDGRDFREIIDGWMQRGWIDTLHTPGPGDLPRDAVAQGLAWLDAAPHRGLTVWTNHSITCTPLCIAPGDSGSALVLAVKNTIKLGTWLLDAVGLESVAHKIAVQVKPRSFPPGQQAIGWGLTVLLVASVLWVTLALRVRRLRRRWALAAELVGLGLAIITLSTWRLNYALGDDPGSPYYVADLARRSGLRYYWLLQDAPGYTANIVADTLVLPERSYNGRSSFLAVVSLDDGTRVLAFSRGGRGPGGYQSLEMLTQEALDDLCRAGGTAILYTHWTDQPTVVFSAEALAGLSRLRDAYLSGRIWVAPTAEILRHTFVRTFLEYTVRTEDGTRTVIDILRVNDPAGEPFVPSVADLAGLAFECSGDRPVEVRLAGEPIDPGRIKIIGSGARIVVSVALGG